MTEDEKAALVFSECKIGFPDQIILRCCESCDTAVYEEDWETGFVRFNERVVFPTLVCPNCNQSYRSKYGVNG